MKSKGGICTRAYEMQAADRLQSYLDVRAGCQRPDRLRGSIHQSVDLTTELPGAELKCSVARQK